MTLKITNKNAIIGTAILVASVFVVIIFRAVPFDGTLVLKSDITRPVPWIREPKPKGWNATAFAPVTEEASLFAVSPPGTFEMLTVTARYKNSRATPIEIGALAGKNDGQFLVRGLENPTLDTLSWPKISENGLTLWQRTATFPSVEAFLKNPPARERVATYDAPFPSPFVLSSYIPRRVAQSFAVNLRGSHRILAYVKNESLSFSFLVQDMNRQVGEDSVVIAVYALRDSASPLARAELVDDGNVSTDQRSSALRTIAASVTDLPEGVYQIIVSASPDIFVRDLTTSQQKFVFADHVYMGDVVGYEPQPRSARLVSDSVTIEALTSHVEGVQTLRVAGRPLNIFEPLQRYTTNVRPNEGPVTILAPKSDILVSGDGVFAVDSAHYFNPMAHNLGPYITRPILDAWGVDFVFARYQSPSVDAQGFREASAQFQMSSLARDTDGAWDVVFSVPGVKSLVDPPRIASLTFTFTRQPLTLFTFVARVADIFLPDSRSSPQILSTGKTYVGISP